MKIIPIAKKVTKLKNDQILTVLTEKEIKKLVKKDRNFNSNPPFFISSMFKYCGMKAKIINASENDLCGIDIDLNNHTWHISYFKEYYL